MGEGGYFQISKTLDIEAFDEYLETQCRKLPALPDVQKISPRVIRVLEQNPGKVRGPMFPGQDSDKLVEAVDQLTYGF